ncbi:MAG TPA: LacI family DNA-binding transcriptional regulator [Microlunatus sp.]|nr:LacI family DNA-binding transcriptional regulator [Microlunatus sp.]
MGRVTAKTVAQAVGVSVATVSNAYNRPNQLSAELRTKILAKAEELGYAGPDAAARALRSGKTDAIGVMLTERLSYAFSDPYAIGFLAGLAEVVEQRGTSIVLIPLPLESELIGEGPDLTTVRQASIDSMTTLCVADDHPARILAKTRGIRLVGTNITDDPEESWVAIDDEAAGRLVGEELVRLGHRHVVVIADTNAAAGSPARRLAIGDIDCIDCAARLRGLAAALPEPPVVVSAGHNAHESGVGAARWIIDQLIGPDGPDAPTAIVGLSDVVALGVLEVLRDAGFQVPGQISVCGFDDIPAAGQAGLTTMRQPIGGKGRIVGELLLDPDATPRQVLLPMELVVRDTTGPAATS